MNKQQQVRRAIAIRNSIAAKAAAKTGTAPAAAEKPAKAPRLVVAKGVSFPSDAGKVRMFVSKGEVALALGLDGAKDSPAGRGLKAVADAVSQSAYAKDGTNVTRLGDRIDGVDGLKSLHDDFGNGAVRALWFDGEKLAGLVGADVEGFSALQVASDARAEASDKRWVAIKAKNAARAAEKAAAGEGEGERLAA